MQCNYMAAIVLRTWDMVHCMTIHIAEDYVDTTTALVLHTVQCVRMYDPPLANRETRPLGSVCTYVRPTPG